MEVVKVEKTPATVEAVQYKGDDYLELMDHFGSHRLTIGRLKNSKVESLIIVHSGEYVYPGDWIVKEPVPDLTHTYDNVLVPYTPDSFARKYRTVG